MEDWKEVTMDCGSNTKLFAIDFGSYQNTIDAIQRKFNIPKDFALKVVSDHNGKRKEISIDNDEELKRFRDSREFIVRLLDDSHQLATKSLHQSGLLTYQPGRSEAAACTPPPSYEQSQHTADLPQPKFQTRKVNQRRASVVSDGIRKLVNFDMSSLATTKAAITKKFCIVGDFDILGKLPGEKEPFDIQNDDDLVDCKDSESFLVKRKSKKERQFGDESDHSKTSQSNKRRMVSDGERRKMVNIDITNLANTKDAIRTKFSIVGGFDILGKLHGEKEPFDIQTDDDLDDCKDAESFLVNKRVNKKKQSGDESGHSKVTLKIKFEAHDEFVSIDLECLRSTRNAISQMFKIDDDISLLVKKKGVGEYIDVDDDDDLAALTADDVLLVERKSNKNDTYGPESAQVVPSNTSQAVVAVRIGEVDYPVYQIPRDDSVIVREAVAELRSDFGLKELVSNTDVIADCLRLARYGVAGDPELNTAVGKIMSSLGEMVQRNKSAVVRFRMKGADILSDLVSGVRFILDGEVSVGVTKFKGIKGKAELLLQQTSLLQQGAEDRQKDINEVLSTIMRTKGQHFVSKQNAHKIIQEARKNELDRRLTVAKHDVAVSDERVAEHAKEIETEKTRVKAALDKKTGCGHGCRYGYCDHGWCPCLPYSRSECCYRCCSGGRFCRHKHRRFYWYWRHLYCHDHGHGLDEKRVKAEQALQKKAEEDHRQEMRERKKLREEEYKAFEELQNHLKSMTLEGNQLPDDFTERALRAADGAFRNMQLSVRVTALFWEKMNEYCTSLGSAGVGVDAIVEKSETCPDNIENYINTDGFRAEAVSLYARLVALKRLCLEFDTKMKPVEVSIQQSILDYPSQKEALEKIPKLQSALDMKLQSLKTELAIAAEEHDVDQQ